MSWTTPFSSGRIFTINETPPTHAVFGAIDDLVLDVETDVGFFVNVNVCIFVVSSELRMFLLSWGCFFWAEDFLQDDFLFQPKALEADFIDVFAWQMLEMNICMSNLHHDKSQKANPWKPNKTRWLKQLIRDGNYRPLWGLFGCSPVPNQTIILFIVIWVNHISGRTQPFSLWWLRWWMFPFPFSATFLYPEFETLFPRPNDGRIPASPLGWLMHCS